MKPLLFGPWEPDKPPHLSTGLQTANNVYAGPLGYRPVKAFTAVTSALPAMCKGAASFASPQGVTSILAGTASGLYRAFANGWQQIGSGYGIQGDGRWRFAQFGGVAIATNGSDDMQKVDLSAGTVSLLGGTPPKAKLLAVVKDFLVAGVVDGTINALRWSGINNAESWTIGTNQSDYQIMPAGGEITGLLGGEFGLILQRNRVSRMDYVGDNLVFQFSEIASNVGCVTVHSVAQAGTLGFWYSDNGFVMWDGAAIKFIGNERVDRWFAARYNRLNWAAMSTAIDLQNKIVAWSMGNLMLCYAWELDRWSVINQAAEIIFSGTLKDTTLDEMDALFGTLDDVIPQNLDADDFKGGDPLFYVVDSDHMLGLFSGSNMVATLAMGDLELVSGREATLRGVRPLTDAVSGLTLTLGGKARLGDALSTTDYTSLTTSGDMPVRHRWRYTRPTLVHAAGSSWGYSQGIEMIPGVSGGAR